MSDTLIKELKTKRKKFGGSVTEVYTRIVGYYRAVSNWNVGKAQEYKERKTFDIKKSKEAKEKSKLFWKNGCPQCAQPKAWAMQYPSTVDVISLDEHPEHIVQYNLMSTPTLVVFKEGIIDHITHPEEIKKFLELQKT